MGINMDIMEPAIVATPKTNLLPNFSASDPPKI